MTQHLDMMRAMAEQSTLPIVADLDTGFGNAINVIHAVKNYERAGAAAVVIEDKSFSEGHEPRRSRASGFGRIEEFQGKIDAPCRLAAHPTAGDRARRGPDCRTSGKTKRSRALRPMKRRAPT